MHDPRVPALVSCHGAFGTIFGKTAHGLLRFGSRFLVVGVIDPALPCASSRDVVPDGVACPVFVDLDSALGVARPTPQALVVGVAPSGYGDINEVGNEVVRALTSGLDVYSGLHLRLAELPEVARAVATSGRQLVEVRHSWRDRRLEFFDSGMSRGNALVVCVLGQDGGVGKRTCAIRLWKALNEVGVRTAVVGTGQTAVLQGLVPSICLDALPMDFATGELQRVVREAAGTGAKVIVVEGQGSLGNPAYGCETLALIQGTRPDGFVYVVCPFRKAYADAPTMGIAVAKEEVSLLGALGAGELLGVVANNFGCLELPPEERCALHELADGNPVLVGSDGPIEPLVRRIQDLVRARP